MSEETFATKQFLTGNSLPNKLWIKISSKQIPKENCTKEYLKKHAYQKIPKGKSQPKNIWREISPKKIFQTISLPNIISKFYQGNSEDTFSAKKSKEKYLPNNLSRDISLPKKSEETSKRKKTSEEKSLPIKEETSPPKNLTNIITRNMAKIRTHEIWGKPRFFQDFINSDLSHCS